jgi:Plavaka transposase
MIENLPDAGARWLVEDIVPISGEPVLPISLYYRDPIKAIKSLLCRPSLADCMEFAPRRVWADASKTKRLYSEMSTGEWWWRNQVFHLTVTYSVLIP